MPKSPALPCMVFAPTASAAFGVAVASALGIPLSALEERIFDGGEYVPRAPEGVRGRIVYVVQGLFGDALGSANDRLCALLFLIAALKDAGAGSVTACVPYLAYARQDRHSGSGDPVTTRYVAQMFEAVGVDRVMVLDVHDPAAFDNAFRCETVRLDAAALFVRHFAAQLAGNEVAAATPDIGGARRARRFQRLLETAVGRPVKFAFMDKQRMADAVTGSLFAGEVAGRRVIIFDDLISSGATVAHAITACRRAGATRVDVAATHAAFAPGALRLFGTDRPDGVIVTDSIPLASEFAAQLTRTLSVLPAAECFAAAIRQLEPEYCG